LIFRDRNDRQRLFFFSPGSKAATVGRAPSSDLVLDWDDQVSRLHARFEDGGSGWVLVDDGLSSNGTFVNEKRLSGRRPLTDGDIMRFGTTLVTFRSPQRKQSAAADVVEKPPAARGAADKRPDGGGAVDKPAPVRLSTTQRRVLAALCRPYKRSDAVGGPASDQQIADELVVSVGEVRAHLRVLSAKLGVDAVPESTMRARLAQRAVSAGLISERGI
jgi:hypothetical protein